MIPVYLFDSNKVIELPFGSSSGCGYWPSVLLLGHTIAMVPLLSPVQKVDGKGLWWEQDTKDGSHGC